MATSQTFQVCDNSTLTNFKAWSMNIAGFFATAGWVQSGDTGQVNWSTIVSAPSTGATYVYEIWTPNDGLTPFYLKVEYGNASSSGNAPTLRLSISQATDGAGTLTGSTVGPFPLSWAYTTPSSSTTYETDLSGDLGRIHAILWRTAPNSAVQLFSIERSVNSSGVHTGQYVTLFTGGQQTNFGVNFNQQSLLFGVGPAPICQNFVGGKPTIPFPLMGASNSSVSGSFNNTIPFALVPPMVGYLDWPMLGVGCGFEVDYANGITFTTTVYGTTHTYIPISDGSNLCGGNDRRHMVAIRYD